ncbi:HIT family protein [Allostella vacuolata]|nr:HIT family protein [Stella vacuolata]
MPNATMTKFGFPRTLVAETRHWVVLVRPQQVTLGSLVLVCREPVTAFGQASPAAFADLQAAVAATERVLQGFVGYERINYLMLMMVDPDVHFHVIPRYSSARERDGVAYPDAGWPGPPNLGQSVALDDAAQAALASHLRGLWPAG